MLGAGVQEGVKDEAGVGEGEGGDRVLYLDAVGVGTAAVRVLEGVASTVCLAEVVLGAEEGGVGNSVVEGADGVVGELCGEGGGGVGGGS